jgi:hypothetical protein
MTQVQWYIEVLFDYVAYINHQNKRVAFNPDVQDIINRLDVKTILITRNNHHKQMIRGPNNDVSNRSRSEIDRNDRNVVDKTTTSKLQALCKSTNKGFSFPLHDAVTFKAQGNFQKYRSAVRIY